MEVPSSLKQTNGQYNDNNKILSYYELTSLRKSLHNCLTAGDFSPHCVNFKEFPHQSFQYCISSPGNDASSLSNSHLQVMRLKSFWHGHTHINTCLLNLICLDTPQKTCMDFTASSSHFYVPIEGEDIQRYQERK